ncbi:LPS export ABC transporter periplasmic protein LptC, partial [Klebsiella aerogenes]|uniref:LPS export ABC transporter periplasmic protein LptC n=3 Tax=Pseudomonadota TaxID=1224 RepID=UPI0013D5A440
NISAEIPVGQDLRAQVNAKGGLYDNANRQLKLDNNITLTTSDGMKAQLKSADINIQENSMSTDQPVKIENSSASIVADSMKITQSG